MHHAYNVVQPEWDGTSDSEVTLSQFDRKARSFSFTPQDYNWKKKKNQEEEKPVMSMRSK